MLKDGINTVNSCIPQQAELIQPTGGLIKPIRMYGEVEKATKSLKLGKSGGNKRDFSIIAETQQGLCDPHAAQNNCDYVMDCHVAYRTAPIFKKGHHSVCAAVKSGKYEKKNKRKEYCFFANQLLT